MESSNSLKTKLLDVWLDANRERYKRLTESRRAIATKAQGNVAIAGIFVAIVFNWITGIIDAKTELICYQVIGLVSATSLFLFSVITSVFVLFVDEIPVSKECELINEVLNARSKYSSEYIHLLYSDLNIHWEKVNEALDKFNLKKGKQLFLAQVTLAFGIVLIGFVTAGLIISSK